MYAVSGVRSAIPLAANFTYFFDYEAEPKKKKKAEPVQHRYTKAGSVQQVMNHYGVFRIVFENFAIQIDKVASLLMKLFDFSGRI